MARNRQKTESRIRQAAFELLEREGFQAWGINAIAREAGVDKVLIYRYFNSVEGLLDELIQETDFWPDPETLPNRSAEAFINGTRESMSPKSHAHAFLSHPTALRPLSAIRRKYTADLERWLRGFRKYARGHISNNQLERLPALIHFQASTGRESLSPYEMWKQVSPPLDWEIEYHNDSDGDLPPEML